MAFDIFQLHGQSENLVITQRNSPHVINGAWDLKFSKDGKTASSEKGNRFAIKKVGRYLALKLPDVTHDHQTYGDYNLVLNQFRDVRDGKDVPYSVRKKFVVL